MNFVQISGLSQQAGVAVPAPRSEPVTMLEVQAETAHL